jgi:hypothetical protein
MMTLKRHETDVVRAVNVLTNPLQAALLEQVLPQVLPERRLYAAAAILGISVRDIYLAATVTAKVQYWWGVKDRGVPSDYMVNLAKCLGVKFTTLWDDDALDTPRLVLAPVPSGKPVRTANRASLRVVRRRA